MGITAAFDRTLFFNEASRYTVLRLKTADIMIPEEARSPYTYRDHLIRFTAVGYDLPRTDTVKVDLEGTWADGKYGCQLQVERWKEIVPPTVEGIRGYLASGLLKGIGEKTADAIVARFGADSLDVLEHHPERLLEIRGVTGEKLEEIRAGYAESKTLRELMVLLGPFKVTPATAQRIYRHFGPDGVELLRRSPYRLCEVHGFGFRRVDDIVQKSGGDLHDPGRIQGALFYALEKAGNEDGHLFLETRALIRSALLLLNEKIARQEDQLAQAQAERELEAMIRLNVVVSNKGNIYLPRVFTQEMETAARVVTLDLAEPERVELRPVLEKVRGRLGITLSRRQTEAVAMAFRHDLSIITGGPGTGKSTILRAVVEAYRALYPTRAVLLAAPTGKASRRMAETTGVSGAQTIHALLGLCGEDGGRKNAKPLEPGLLIVDESSMMDMWLAHQLFTRVPKGMKVLLVGDADQLESVGAGNVFQELIDSGVVPVTVLDQIFRQAKDSRIAYNAKFINQGSGELFYGPDFRFIAAADQEEAAGRILELYRAETARSGLKNVQVLCPYRTAGAASARNMNEAIRELVNPERDGKPEVLSGGRLFRLGDRVMQVRNNYDIDLLDESGAPVSRGVFNGEIGTVSRIEDGSVRVDYDGRFARYPSESLDELELAYAATVHKAMGSEYETVIVPLLAAHRILLTRNLLYTAVTRAKGRVLLVGQKKALFMAVSRTRKGKRNTLLAERIRLIYHARTRRPPPVEERRAS